MAPETIQYLIITCNGKESEKEYTHTHTHTHTHREKVIDRYVCVYGVCMAKSLCCASEMNTTL